MTLRRRRRRPCCPCLSRRRKNIDSFFLTHISPPDVRRVRYLRERRKQSEMVQYDGDSTSWDSYFSLFSLYSFSSISLSLSFSVCERKTARGVSFSHYVGIYHWTRSSTGQRVPGTRIYLCSSFQRASAREDSDRDRVNWTPALRQRGRILTLLKDDLLLFAILRLREYCITACWLLGNSLSYFLLVSRRALKVTTLMTVSLRSVPLLCAYPRVDRSNLL